MSDPRYPFSFSPALASPDMAVDWVPEESVADRVAREIAAEDNVHPDNPAYTIVVKAIQRTLERFNAPKEVNGAEEPEPVDLLFSSINDWKPGTVDAEFLVGSVEIKLGRLLMGQERVNLLSLAGNELVYDNERFGKDEE